MPRMVAFAPKGKYMLLKGRFDWKSLKSYVLRHGRQVQQFLLQAWRAVRRRSGFHSSRCNRT